MTPAMRLDQWTRDAAEPFEGWDFSHLDGRMHEDEPSWSYIDLARSAVDRARDVLDVATGGGEIFSSFAPFQGRARAVEGYLPNLAVARRRLEPLGVEVFRGNTQSGMPFEDESFDLVLNRHGGFRAAEMCRILKPAGTFLSQQVGGDNLADLTERFGGKLAYPGNTLAHVCDAFRSFGCEIKRSEEWRGRVTFRDVGALVYFLKAIPWIIDGFDVERHGEILESLHWDLQSRGTLEFSYSRFLVEAVKA